MRALVRRQLIAEIGIADEARQMRNARGHGYLLDWIEREVDHRLRARERAALAAKFAGDRRVVFPAAFGATRLPARSRPRNRPLPR